MKPRYISEKQVLDVLKVDSFQNLPEDKRSQFVSMLPYMNKEVAVAIVSQFPEYSEFATSMMEQLNVMCNNILKSNDDSQREAVGAYKMILDNLDERLQKETLSFEEKQKITEQMVYVADRISAKDTENKKFLDTIFKHGAIAIGGTLRMGAAIFGSAIMSGGSRRSLRIKGDGERSKSDDDDLSEQDIIDII